MACNNCGRCNCWHNDERRENEVRGVSRNCRPLVNDINRLIRDIREDTAELDRKFDELEDQGCVRGINSGEDNWDCHWDCWNWCYRHCNNRRG
ncbi:hypothetical protein PBV87_15465 [Niameybacter massiliensis]|uniref:Uncharacterized protein n=1 Tax=Holtiella tumoricola TaxID=3018743 RepID=A0AA42J1Y5_9FIRM|nr:hypothetical protein [Holtiella tumoricola]MDA3732875.1 hypothetical protein [Holtiella tumoricola]